MTPVFRVVLLVLFSTKEENGELKIAKNVHKVNFVMQAQMRPKHVQMVITPIASESDLSPIVSFVLLVSNVIQTLVQHLYLHRYHVVLGFIPPQVQLTVMHVKRDITVTSIQLALKPCCTLKSVRREHTAPMIQLITSTMTSFRIW